MATEHIVTEVNRQEAMRLALGLARPGDLLAQDWPAIPVIKEFGLGGSPRRYSFPVACRPTEL